MCGADQDSVRLLAVECCGPLAKLSGKEGVVTHILPVVQKFSQVPLALGDDALSPLCCPLLLLLLLPPPQLCATALQRTYDRRACPQDKSWRVRYNVAQQLTSLCEALGPELSR